MTCWTLFESRKGLRHEPIKRPIIPINDQLQGSGARPPRMAIGFPDRCRRPAGHRPRSEAPGYVGLGAPRVWGGGGTNYPEHSREALAAAALSLRISVYEHRRNAENAESPVKADVERGAADVLEHMANQVEPQSKGSA